MMTDDRPFEFVRLDGVSVLVVDDNADARVIFKHVLTYAGASVLTASSATAAVRTLQQLDPDVVLSDLSMPKKDGLWLLGWIRKRDARRQRHLPVIAVTARDDLYPESSPDLVRFDAYLTKPVTSRLLYSTIAGIVGRGRPASATVSA